jgi:tRNA pseudouridine32 synthase/23S rRNA pseudouridine746 synthase
MSPIPRGRTGPDAAVPVSRLYLPPEEARSGTLLDFLAERFPQVSPETWQSRMEAGRVFLDDGCEVSPQTEYQAGRTVLYKREVIGETVPDSVERIVYQDSRVVVADKPHGMPVTPCGDVVDGSLLVRLRRRTGFGDLTPAHRIDRDTAGLVLCVVQREDRGRYQQLFQQGQVDREYRAIARTRADGPARWNLAHRIGPGTPWFRQEITPGPPNAFTDVESLGASGKLRKMEAPGGWGWFRIRPRTGKKHQIRVQMARIGCPILGDALYGVASDRPLQLLARRLAFRDPLCGEGHAFVSGLRLEFPEGSRDP